MSSSIENDYIIMKSDVRSAEWDDSASVIVIGAGCAGLAAALEAREQGADVLVIDRFEGGGATAYSGGVVYAGDTSQQKQAGYADSSDNMFRYLKSEVGDAISERTLQRFCRESAPNLLWLAKQGVQFSGELFSGKTSYPPPGKFLYFSGNERTAHNAALADPAPRGHRTVGNGWTGKVLFARLMESALNAGVRFAQHTRVTRLILNDDRNVVGVEGLAIPSHRQKFHQHIYRKVNPWKPFLERTAKKAADAAEQLEVIEGKRRVYRATRGVVIATGGYAFNQKMLKKYNSRYAEASPRFLRMGSLACDGSGIQMAQAVGADVGKMDRVYAGRSLAPPEALLHGIIVNSEGKRFINEDACNAFLGNMIANQADGKAWLIVSAKKFRAAAWALLPRDKNWIPYSAPKILNIVFGGTKYSTSLIKLAHLSNIEPDNLVDTVNKYNLSCKNCESDLYGKGRSYCTEILGGYFSIRLDLGRTFSFTQFFTLGGLRVDENNGGVLDKTGAQIAGLYAAGRAAVGIPSNAYACSGLSLADAVFSGRRAGRSAAQRRGFVPFS